MLEDECPMLSRLPYRDIVRCWITEISPVRREDLPWNCHRRCGIPTQDRPGIRIKRKTFKPLNDLLTWDCASTITNYIGGSIRVWRPLGGLSIPQ